VAFLKSYGRQRRSGRHGRLTQEHIAAMASKSIELVKRNKDALSGMPEAGKIIKTFEEAARNASKKSGNVGLAELHRMAKENAPIDEMTALAKEVENNFNAAGCYSSLHSKQKAFIGQFLKAGLH
jgi:hypothetical protein